MWHDEVFTAYAATRSTSHLLAIIAEREGNMPLYYLLMHLWAQGGTGSGWMRVPSVAAFVATVPVVALIARRVFGAGVAVLAALLLAVSGFALDYTRNARTYPFSMLLAAATTLLLLRAVDSGARRWWAAYGVAGLLAIGAHPLSATLVLIAQTVALALVPGERLPRRRAAGVLATLYAYSGCLALYVVRVQSSSTDFIEPTNLGALVHFVDQLAGSRLLAAVFAVLGAVALVGLARTAHWRSSELWQRALVLSWLVVPPLTLLVVSELRPLWRSRYLLTVVPPLAVLIAFALTRLRPQALQVAAVAAVLVLAGSNARQELQEPAVEDLPAGAEHLLAESRPTDALVYSGAATRTPFGWVLQQQAGSRELPRDVALAPGGAAEEVRDLFAEEVDPATLTGRLARCERVWVVGLPEAKWHPTPEPMQAVQRTEFWREEFREVAQHDFGGLRVELFENERSDGRAEDCGS
jgi:mannosyltransferase